MIELINYNKTCETRRWKLLSGASALVLVAYVSSAVVANAQDSDEPALWIELGGQLERADGGSQAFAPPFTDQFLTDNFLNAATLQRSPRYSSGFEGSLRFAPDGTGWTFEASVRYGRSNRTRSTHNQMETPVLVGIISVPALDVYQTRTFTPNAVRVADAAFRGDERHLLLDFTAGRDVGLGGVGKSLNFNAGIRVAQFTSKSNVKMTANPGGNVTYKYISQFGSYPAYIRIPNVNSETWDLYHASASITRSFRGLGPYLSLEGSIPVAGRPEAMEINFDLGVNGALLFGRQKTVAAHETSDDRPYIPHPANFKPMVNYYHHHYDVDRSHSATVPNIGGFAAISFRYSDAKIKLGYRADAFFGAMDGGIDTRKTYDRDFYGPFATISIGLGG